MVGECRVGGGVACFGGLGCIRVGFHCRFRMSEQVEWIEPTTHSVSESTPALYGFGLSRNLGGGPDLLLHISMSMLRQLFLACLSVSRSGKGKDVQCGRR